MGDLGIHWRIVENPERQCVGQRASVSRQRDCFEGDQHTSRPCINTISAEIVPKFPVLALIYQRSRSNAMPVLLPMTEEKRAA